MKRLILILCVIFISINAYAFFHSKKPKKVEKVVEIKKEPSKPVFCIYSIDISEGNFYIFKGGCLGFLQIGIVETRKNKLIFIDPKGKITRTSTSTTTIDMQKDIEINWGNINTVKFSSGK